MKFPRHLWIVLPGLALVLHAMVVLCFALRWDRAAMITVVPFPFWCAAGLTLSLLSLAWKRTTLGWLVAALWSVTLLQADELRPWRHPFLPRPAPGPAATLPDGRKPLRLVSLHVPPEALPAAAEEILPWQPDIVFLQGLPASTNLDPLARKLFGNHAFVAANRDCATLARGHAMQRFDFTWPVVLPVEPPAAVCTRLTLPDGRPLDLLNLNLMPAEQSAGFWSRRDWSAHAQNRRLRRFQLALLLSSRKTAASGLAPAPLVAAGDFHTPARDASLLPLAAAGFSDSYRMAASRPGNTTPNDFPLLRTCQSWFSPDLIPMRHAAVKTIHSRHRIIVVDFLYP